MKLVAVIGTNGKTTTSHLIYNVLKQSNVKCGLIGTLGTYYLDKYIEPTLTTPDPLELHKTLYEMFNLGIKVVVMEVSAHAIYLDKVKNIDFYCAVFTNFSQDHLDFFSNMENYKNAKLKFFKENKGVTFRAVTFDNSINNVVEIVYENEKFDVKVIR